jgi:uncharacterized membrane protein
MAFWDQIADWRTVRRKSTSWKEQIMTESSQSEIAGIGALFDMSFSRFITVSIIRILYILGMCGIAIGWFGLVIGGFSRGAAAGLGILIVATIMAAIYLIFLRVWLELIVVVFRIGDDTSVIARAYRAASPGGFPVTPLPQQPAPPPGL